MRQEKELLKDEIKEKIERFKSFVIMQYSKLSANAANEFRREVGKLGGDVGIIRKRVLLKAVQDAGIDIDPSIFEGHIGLVFLAEEDPLEITKYVFKFSKEREKVIGVLGGRFDGQLYSGEDVERLSKLPSRDGMRAELLSVLEAPLSQTLAVMEALLTCIPFCLENKAKQERGDD
jgi:large subunit ribosomal protein L10